MSDPAILHLRSAAFGYADRTVLSGVDLSVRAGEVVAVVGANGSGKSTLVKGILGLNRRAGGAVDIFGVDQEHFDERHRLGYVPQRHSLSASVRATVREIVSTGRVARRPWWRPAGREDARLVDEAIAAVGLADRADTEVALLSGGQQRRVLIARALSGQPDILVLDEPTAGVDADSQHVLADVLAALAGRGTTMLIVTHELAALSPIVTRVVVMAGGRIAADVPADEFTSGRVSVHDHDHHHHDFELDLDLGTSPTVVPTSGPLDPGGRRHA